MLKRFLYYAYYLKQMNWPLLTKFMEHVHKTKGTPTPLLWARMSHSVFKYNISLLEYFQFRFFDKEENEKSEWAGTGYMYEYQLIMNPKSSRDILDDKTKFYKAYRDFFVHDVADLEDLKKQPALADKILANPAGKLVFKVADGKCGAQVLIKPTKEFAIKSLLDFMAKEGYDLVEAFLLQHPELNKLSPSAVNTVRIFTQLNAKNEVELLGCRQRISVNSPVDNMAAGNLAAPIDDHTGIVNGPGVYSDITKSDEETHPITGVPIRGFQVPFWKETIEMVEAAALAHPENRSIGWDIVITEKGPGLIEGNHDWCKLLWQLPVKQGLKNKLEKHLVNGR